MSSEESVCGHENIHTFKCGKATAWFNLEQVEYFTF